MATPSPLARRVRLVRELVRLTKRGLSARAGLNPSHVRLLEASGQRTAFATVSQVAAALGVRSEWLFNGDLPAFEGYPEVDPTNPKHTEQVRMLSAKMSVDLSAPPAIIVEPPPKPQSSARKPAVKKTAKPVTTGLHPRAKKGARSPARPGPTPTRAAKDAHATGTHG